jgi:hypothetical protein
MNCRLSRASARAIVRLEDIGDLAALVRVCRTAQPAHATFMARFDEANRDVVTRYKGAARDLRPLQLAWSRKPQPHRGAVAL